jgi:hypothetical protein
MFGYVKSGHSGEGLSYIFSRGSYDYRKNPLNTIIRCIGYNISGKYSLPIPVEVKAVEKQQQTTVVGSDDIEFKIGNLSYIEYTSKAKTNVDFIVYVK